MTPALYMARVNLGLPTEETLGDAIAFEIAWSLAVWEFAGLVLSAVVGAWS